MTVYIILASNSMQAFGTKSGHPFNSEASANRESIKLDKKHPALGFLVLPVTPLGSGLKEPEEEPGYDPEKDVREPCGKPSRHQPHWHKHFTRWCEGRPTVDAEE